MTIQRDPELIWNPLSEFGSQALITPRQWIVHTAVDGPGPTNLHSFFEYQTTLESHTWLRWDRHEQFMHFDRRADANFRANQFFINGTSYGAISTETEDDGDPVDHPWNEYQLTELVRFGVWLVIAFGIPPVLPVAWDAPGMGYHSLFPGVWSNVAGKTCPGATRIYQFKSIVLPAIQRAFIPTPPTRHPGRDLVIFS